MLYCFDRAYLMIERIGERQNILRRSWPNTKRVSFKCPQIESHAKTLEYPFRLSACKQLMAGDDLELRRLALVRQLNQKLDNVSAEIIHSKDAPSIQGYDLPDYYGKGYKLILRQAMTMNQIDKVVRDIKDPDQAIDFLIWHLEARNELGRELDRDTCFRMLASNLIKKENIESREHAVKILEDLKTKYLSKTSLGQGGQTLMFEIYESLIVAHTKLGLFAEAEQYIRDLLENKDLITGDKQRKKNFARYLNWLVTNLDDWNTSDKVKDLFDYTLKIFEIKNKSSMTTLDRELRTIASMQKYNMDVNRLIGRINRAFPEVRASQAKSK